MARTSSTNFENQLRFSFVKGSYGCVIGQNKTHRLAIGTLLKAQVELQIQALNARVTFQVQLFAAARMLHCLNCLY